MSRDLKSFLHSRGVATSRTTPYHPTGNAQCERYNQTIWKTVQLFLRNNRLPEEQWEMVLTDALHSVRSLLCTATNATPHEQFLSFPRKSMLGKSLPSWLTSPGTVLLRRFVRQRKSDPLCDEVELVEANPSFAHVRYPDGRETTVALKDLAPCPTVTESSPDDEQYNQESTVSVDTLIPSPSPPQPVVFNPSTTSPPSTPGPSTPPASPTIPPAGDKTSTTPPFDVQLDSVVLLIDTGKGYHTNNCYVLLVVFYNSYCNLFRVAYFHFFGGEKCDNLLVVFFERVCC